MAHKSIPLSANGLYEARLGLTVSEGLPNLSYSLLDRVVLADLSSPHARTEVLFRDNPPAMLDQVKKGVERSGSEGDLRFPAQQSALFRMKSEVPKSYCVQFLRSRRAHNF